MTIEIKPLVQENRFKRILIHGIPGTGKTHFIGTMPKPLLYCESDPGGGDTLLGIDGIDIVRIDRFDQMNEVYQILKKENKYVSLAVDSLTTLQFPLMDEVSVKSKVTGVNWTPDQTGWGEVLARYRRMVMAINQLPLHIVYIALSAIDTEEVSQQKMIMPLLKGAFGNLIGALVSSFGYAYIDKGEWMLSFQPNNKYLAKLRMRDITLETKLTFSNPKFDDLVSDVFTRSNNA